ncbi:bifunctional transcriptional activator/DNA repair enzyme AdaA [Legionella sp. km772]|uniref:bifunctional transcriptional activator/DNA repair enzyme AdaA n=1 Tax=Legionella sp. km772 TaxID=2498111 RepID=UPI000F8C5951|nr:trifunctional transcriptional activator/DNA repair protein Ada/methylated-DNA--[protein]-cysteine S-methyltransferase [Legionella sp. km772]RUR13179.1 bifunctional transcriptional activator/DNA repair protein Ada [Legionella sp. km772]
MNLKKQQEYYQALLARDSSYDGLFYVGVKTTRIFCHVICPARKPKFENCEFFSTAKEALLASYRPCLRCKPLLAPNQQSPVIERLIAAVESHPEKRWKDRDFKELGIDESTARRQFKKRFGMTFVEYARARRMGLAMNYIKNGHSIIDAQLQVGYGSSSGFRDAFSRALGDAPVRADGRALLAAWIDTPLGPMIAIVDHSYLYLLEFIDRRGLENEIERLRVRLRMGVIPGRTIITEQIEQEVNSYFSGVSFQFSTPCYLLGSTFQKAVWEALRTIPTGQTCSYLALARAIGNEKAFRAVANANGKIS